MGRQQQLGRHLQLGRQQQLGRRQVINEELSKVNKWLERNKLSLNIYKTK